MHRDFRPRVLRVGTALLCGALVLTGCTAKGGGDAGADQRSRTLIIAENEPPASFDPIQADNSTVDEVVTPLYDTLVDFTPDGQLTGELATKWEVSSDATSISVELRDDVTFHDGAKLTAEDVRFTLDRIKKLNTGVAAELQAYESTEVADDTHLTIRLSRPYAPFINALSRVYVLNSKLVQSNAGSDDGKSWLANHDAGSGPYKLVSYQANQEAVFERYADYWGGFDKQAQKVVFRYLPEAATQRDALRQGDIDIAMDIDPVDWQTFEGNPEFVVDKADTLVQLYGFFKMKGGPTANPKLREAVSHAYDYASHVKDILYGAGKPAQGPLPTAMPCHDATVVQPEYSLEKARQALAESGLSNVKLTMTYLPVINEHKRAGTLLQSALREIGIELELKGVTFPAYVDMIKSNDTTPDIGMIYAFPMFPDPHAVLSTNFDSQFIGNGYNYGGYANSRVDTLVRQAQQTPDQQQRCALYAEAQQLIAKDFASINFANPQYVTVLRADVSGYRYRTAHHQTVDVYAIQLDR